MEVKWAMSHCLHKRYVAMLQVGHSTILKLRLDETMFLFSDLAEAVALIAVIEGNSWRKT